MSVAATTRFTSRVVQPAVPGTEVLSTVRLPGNIDLVAGTVLGIVTGTLASAVHRLTFGGTVTGGTFRLVYGSEITDPITWSGTAATLVANVQAAMDALFGAGNTVVSGTGPYDVTFQNELAGRAIPIPTATNALTGTSPTITPSLQTAGHPGGAGLAAAYNDALSDGTQVARCVLRQDTKTDFRGNVITDRPGTYPSAPVYTAGHFYCSDLVGLDANGANDLGRIVNGAAFNTAGAVIAIA
jgi:hypothetical protein